MKAGIRKRPRIGDVIEIPTPRGLAYAHYTHKHEMYGALIRVFRGTYGQRPVDFADIVNQAPQFVSFFPLGAACNQDIVFIAAHEVVPGDARTFPMFRAGFRDGLGTMHWWAWDGAREWRVNALSSEMKKWPIRGTWNDTLLVARIVSGWTHEKDI